MRAKRIRREQPLIRGDHDPVLSTRARQEADALFKPKRSINKPSFQDPQTSPDQSARKPRILRALSMTVRHEQDQMPGTSAEWVTTEIPKPHFARIRAWVNYGLTAAQVAGIYGVGIDAIERILNQR
jgi:hypothetical protein